MRRKRLLLLAGLVLVSLSAALALALASSGEAAKQRPKRDIFLSAVEWKGSAEVAKEPYPGDSSLPCNGGVCGYESFGPGHEEVDGDPNKWAIETYRFDSAVVFAYAGERVTLNMFGVNSKEHDIVLPEFGKRVVVKRGVLAKLTFNVDKPGIYKIICLTHPPSHQADLVVLPKA
jgi:plastocyanin